LALCNLSLAVVPDRGVGVAGAQAYRELRGPKVIGICPTSGVCGEDAPQFLDANRDLCDELITDCSWYEQHYLIGAVSAALVCVGLSCGTLAEIAWTKWGGKTPVAVVDGTISGIPVEILAETETEVVPLDAIRDWLADKILKASRVGITPAPNSTIAPMRTK
jgi:hypothetical protein